METDKIPQETPIAQASLENEPIHKSLLNQKGNFLLILGAVFIIFIVLGVGGYLLTMNKNSNSNQNAPQSIPTSTKPTSLNEIENWKIYTNEKYGFEVKYDPESSPTEQVENETTGQFTYLLSVKFGTNPLKFPHGYTLTVNKQRALSDYRLELIGHTTDKIDSEEEITTNDKTWTKLNYQIFLTTDYVPVTTAILSQSGYSYAITASTLDIDQILTTFKFAEQNSSNLSKTSPDGSYTVSETMLSDYNTIVVKDSSGKVITNDLIKKNEKAIGYGTKFGCQCGTSFGGWIDGSHFILKIVNGNGEEYQYTVDASTGIVNETSFKKIK